MSLIVQKFGGTSIANIERIRRVAELVASEANKGHQIAVVVSAMAGGTNQLIDWVNDISEVDPDGSEYDVVVSTGEQVTSGLLCLALKNLGISVRSWLGWQLPINTDSVHQRAQIESIGSKAISDSLSKGQVAIVSGFQGIDVNNRLTTLGRGGSDTTAVALAQALKAERCDIYTDVEGVFTADPRIVPEARKLEKVTYLEMLEFSWQGAKVLQPRSVDWAMRNNVPLRVLSSFTQAPGTWVVSAQEIFEPPRVTGIATNSSVAKFILFDLDDVREDLWGKLQVILGNMHIHLDMLSGEQSSAINYINLTFTVASEDRELTQELLERNQSDIGFQKIKVEPQVAQVSVVGTKMYENPEVLETITTCLSEANIVPQLIVNTERKVGLLVTKGQAIEVTRLLHEAFALEIPSHKSHNKVA